MIITNKRAEVLKKIVAKYDEEVRERKLHQKNHDDDFKKYRDYIKGIINYKR